ncbi:MAG: hypothetical protein KDD47_24515, partial [Acidobacteria bacterium]|nr:hypothetical protein [Acidobacteriota bacterium]
MQLRTWLGVILLTGVLPGDVVPAADREEACERPIPIHLTGESCGPLAPPAISCRVPAEVEGGLAQPNHNTVQRATDIFSWQTFLALNWPAGKVRGEPDPSAPINGPGPRVWETWKEAFEIYLPDGSQPPPWDAREPIPPACAGASKRLVRTAKVSDVVDLKAQALPADGTLPATLKDQQGRLVRYEIRLNRPLFEYIADPASPHYSGLALYNGIEQAKADGVDFPVGSQLIKAAWRQVDEAERPFFHVTEACVCDEVGVDRP